MLEHRLAKLAAAATFVLLVVGGTVNPTGSSLACPEPTLVCNGQLFPPMVGGVLYEHGHRLAAMTVGLLQIALTLALLRRARRDRSNAQPNARSAGGPSAGAAAGGRAGREGSLHTAHTALTALAWVLLGLVLLQGALGAITVQYKLPWFVSTGHLLLGMSYFAALIYTAFRTRPAPTEVELDRHARLRDELGGARRWIAIACGAVFVQLLLGALVRHLGAAMVCLGMPACTLGGDWWPDAWVQGLHMIHRGFGVVVAIVTTIAAGAVLRRARSWPALRALALAAPVLVVAQVALGVLTVLSLRAVPLAVGHFAGAAALWALWTSAWLLTARRTAAMAAPERGLTAMRLVQA
jgi:heme a synthase